MANGTRELHNRLLIAQPVAGGAIYCSPPIKTDFLRYGTIHAISSSNTNTGGSLTVYGSNVYPTAQNGEAVDESESSRFAQALGVAKGGGTIGSLAALASVWLGTGLTLAIPNAAALNGALALNPFDYAWLLLVVAPTGSSTSMTLDAWLKMKSGG